MITTPGPLSMATLCRTWRMTLTPTTSHELRGPSHDCNSVLADAAAPAVHAPTLASAMRAFRLRLRRPGPLLPPLRLRLLPSPPLVSKPLHYNVVQVLWSLTRRPLELVHVGRTRDRTGPERQRPAPCCRWVCSNTGCGRGAIYSSFYCSYRNKI